MSEKFQIKLVENKISDTLEIVYNLAGIVFPPFALIGMGYGLVNRKYEKENIEILAKHIEKLHYKFEELENLTSDNKRNMSFNIQKTLNEALIIRAKNKIEILGNLLVNGINKKTIFEDDDEYEEMLTIISSLSMYDFNILRIFNEGDVKKTWSPLHRTISLRSMKTSNYGDGRKVNHLGFDDLDVDRINKLVSLGLIEEFKEYKLERPNIIDNQRIIKGVTSEKKYALTEYFNKLFEYIAPPIKENL